MKNRVKQYLSLILIFSIIVAIFMPITNVYAKGYKISVQTGPEGGLILGSDNTISVGTRLDSGDYLDASNIHPTIYYFPYGYTGEYTPENASNSSSSMSGDNVQFTGLSEQNYIWEVKYIDSSFHLYFQQVYRYDMNINNQTVVDGETANFVVEKNLPENQSVTYKWYRIDSNGSQSIYYNNQILKVEELTATSDKLVVAPNDAGYVNETEFICEMMDENNVTTTCKAKLNIQQGTTITYKSVDGSQIIKTEKCAVGVQKVIDFTNKPTKENCEFLGWSNTANSTTAIYTVTSNKLNMPNEDVILYEVWSVKNLIDVPTKTVVTGTFIYGTILNIEKLEAVEKDYINIKVEVPETKEIIGAFNVTITGSYSGELKIFFEVDEKYEGKTITIYHKLASGEIEEMTTTVIDGKAIITVTELSPFALAVEKGITNVETENPKTGDNVIIYATIAIVLSIAGIAISKKYSK